MKEKELRDVEGYEGLYQVSDTGEVISFNRKIKKVALNPSVNHKGYLRVALIGKDGARKNIFVHRLVAEAFLGKSSLQVNHKDMNKQNNNVENLEYVTNRENTVHSIDKRKTASRYLGVTRCNGRWKAQKMINKRKVCLGVFDTELEAHLRYEMFC